MSKDRLSAWVQQETRVRDAERDHARSTREAAQKVIDEAAEKALRMRNDAATADKHAGDSDLVLTDLCIAEQQYVEEMRAMVKGWPRAKLMAVMAAAHDEMHDQQPTKSE